MCERRKNKGLPSMKVEISKLRIVRNMQNDRGYLTRSIKQHGLIHPILVDRQLNVVDGNRRALSCEDLGMEYIEATLVNG